MKCSDEIIKVEFSYDEAQSQQGLCFGNYKLTLDIDGETLNVDAEVKGRKMAQTLL